ncbi:MAG: hypothetical protein MH825_08335 [Cyanobacteria bacterium]|nr:hypothetical protein [Cyanobacteriota bacterium]
MDEVNNAQSKRLAVWGEQAAAGSLPDSDSVGAAEASSDGARSQPIGVGGTVRARSVGSRPKPGTHGKTLRFLIASVQLQLEDCDREVERIQARRALFESQIEDLKQVLADWEANVALVEPPDDLGDAPIE